MKIAIILVIIIVVASLFATLALAGKNDENYSESTKGNIFRLTWIYVGLAVVLLGGIALYLNI